MNETRRRTNFVRRLVCLIVLSTCCYAAANAPCSLSPLKTHIRKKTNDIIRRIGQKNKNSMLLVHMIRRVDTVQRIKRTEHFCWEIEFTTSTTSSLHRKRRKSNKKLKSYQLGDKYVCYQTICGVRLNRIGTTRYTTQHMHFYSTASVIAALKASRTNFLIWRAL